MGRIITLMILFLAGIISKSFAESVSQDTDIKGKIITQDNQPIAGASVYLMAVTGDVLVKSAVTDATGNYVFIKAPKGRYYVVASSVGYSKERSGEFELGDQALTVEDIKITASSQQIEAVTVERQVPLVRNVNGKLVLNVENSTVAAGNNALEVIKRAPGVSVDQDENLQLMGQQGVTVTIDGRQTYMTGEQLATFLKSTDGSQIKSVEVSTTRSAKDDAEGAVGTINIVLKKNTMEGFNGSFVASAAHGKHFRGNSSLNLNYKKENTTLFGSYAYTDSKREYDLSLYRIIGNGDQSTVFDQTAQLIEPEKNHNYRIGVEQKTSDRNTMVVQFTGNNNDEESENLSTSNIGVQFSPADTVLRSNTYGQNLFNRYSANFNNEFLIDTVGSKLTFDLDWSIFRTANDISYQYRTERPEGGLYYDEERERSSMPVDIDIYVAKLDYVKQFQKGRLESGLKYSNVNSDNNLHFDRYLNDQWEGYEKRSNHFVYNEQIAAAFADYSRTVGKWALKAGLRAEYTVSDGHSITQDNRVKRDYLDLFPSANVGYNASETHIFNLGYARKITRPNYRYLNPFRYYIDKFTFQEGNPYVKPQYTHGLTLTYTLMQMFNFTLGADITNDAMVESMGQDSVTNETWITRDNLAKNTTSYLNINAPFQVGKVWTMNNNVTGIYMHFKGPIAGSFADVGSFFVQANSMHTFKINPQFSAEISLNGNTPFVYNVYKIHGRWNMDAGINYNFKDKRSSLKLAVTDVFRTNKNNISTNFHVFNSDIRQYNDSQTARLTYTFKFGNLKQQIRKRDSDNEESERAN
ncbi:MAG: TonB-dependent receptor domain-containing protein [Sphingobacteriaceae bacterium]